MVGTPAWAPSEAPSLCRAPSVSDWQGLAVTEVKQRVSGICTTVQGLLTVLLTNFIPKLGRQKKQKRSKLVISKAFYSSYWLEEVLAISEKSNNHDSKESFPAQLSQGSCCQGSNGSKTKKYWEICQFWATNLTCVSQEQGFPVIE